jgi:hypothetical protein
MPAIRALPLAFSVFVALAAPALAETGQGLPGAADRVLEKSDARLVAADSSYEMELFVEAPGGRALRYRLRNYVKDSSAQRAIFEEPDFDRGDSAIRRGDRAYFKNSAWPKYDAMNARSSFMDSPFSWEDALGPGLSDSYELTGLRWDDSSGERLLRCVLKPLKAGGYRKIELWLRPGSYQTVKRVYFTPSGREWKTAVYSFPEADSSAAWKVSMVDESTRASASISVGPRRPEKMPDSFFEPTAQNLGK